MCFVRSSYICFCLNIIPKLLYILSQVLKPDRVSGGDSEMTESEAALLAEADPNRQEDLITENAPDPLEGEQTWPTEDELAEATANAGQCTLEEENFHWNLNFAISVVANLLNFNST